MPRILGIDPGLNRTGWGIIRAEGSSLSYVDCGVIRPDASGELHERLRQLHDGLAAVVARHLPDEAAIEETFVNVNGAATLKLGQARGALMLSLSLCGLPVSEYAATLVKKTVVGVGRAEKAQIGMMVATLLPGSKAASPDAADALAIAICHANHRSLKHLLAR
jgi:crossover junction endodeoxyribonuclease RuvC